jgi:hypothetical protein
MIFLFFCNSPTTQTERPTSAYYIQEDMVWAKDVLFEVHNAQNFYLGSYVPKTPSFVAGRGISSLNIESDNFNTAEPILVMRSSNDAAPRKELCYQD